MTLTELAALNRCAQHVANCALLRLHSDHEWYKNNLQSALAEFDKARADLTAAQAQDPGTIDPHGDDA